MTKRTVFLIDDDEIYLKTIEKKLGTIEHLAIRTFNSGESAMKHLNLSPDVVFLDYSLNTAVAPSKTSMEILKEIKIKTPHTKVVMVSSYDNLDYAVTAFKTGASDYILKNAEVLGKIYTYLKYTS